MISEPTFLNENNHIPKGIVNHSLINFVITQKTYIANNWIIRCNINNNSLIEISKKIKVFKNFYWFSKKDLEHLIKKKNILNMDTISVFSSFITKNKEDHPIQKKY